ncbi:Sir2 family NAD-dependent protein deacetylase [Caballeronia sp. 15711]|uniref:Sir2 family NAD-dependent protein deacetylase n=1 Tax=Caballeronia sp. 15711 TaxID=3391029 RepID=UPI0039E4AE68
MSVASGLPAFRGSEGLWSTLLPDGMREGEIGSLTQAECFAARPVQAWKFYGRALEVSRDTPPHDCSRLIQQWAAQKRYGTFVYTSNVDGHFQAAGFAEERVVECHGTINMLQCTTPWGAAI